MTARNFVARFEIFPELAKIYGKCPAMQKKRQWSLTAYQSHRLFAISCPARTGSAG